MAGLIADAFSATGIFDLLSLTQSINRIPRTPTRTGQMNLFAPRGINTLTVVIEEMNKKIGLVSETQRGGPGIVSSPEKRTARPIKIGHIQVDGGLDADDVLGVRAFGSETSEEVLATKVNVELARMRNDIDVTREFRRVRALHGQILDADGSTVLVNLFTEFGVSEVTVDFNFTSATAKIRETALDVLRAVEDGIGNSAMITEFHAFAGKDFFDDLISHPLVRDTFANWEAAADLRTDVRGGFTFGGIVWEEYRHTVSGVKFVADNEARVFPMGAGLYEENFGPADFTDTVNTIGLEMYARSELRRMNKGIDLEAQSNPLALPFFPASLIKCTQS